MVISLEDTAESFLALADAEAVRNRIKELQEERRTLMGSYAVVRAESKQLMEACLAEIQERCEEIAAEEVSISSLGMDELDAFVKRMKKEVHVIEEECRACSDEIGKFTRTIADESANFDKDLQDLESEFFQVESNLVEPFPDAYPDCSFKVAGLSTLIHRNSLSVSSLQDLQNELKRHEAFGQIEDKLSDVKVLDIENNWFRLALKTHVSVDGLPKKPGFMIHPLCLDHELLMEINAETKEILDLKIFPSDVYLDTTIDDAKSSRYSLEKVVRHVQQRILLCSLRSLIVKNANNLGRSIDYVDRDDMLIAHLVGGVDVYLKISHGWPLSDSVLTLASVKTMGTYMETMSLSLLHEIKELGNSVDKDIRWGLPSFLDAIEEIFISRTQAAVQANTPCV